MAKSKATKKSKGKAKAASKKTAKKAKSKAKAKTKKPSKKAKAAPRKKTGTAPRTRKTKVQMPPPLKGVAAPLIPILLDDIDSPAEKTAAKPKTPRARKLKPAQLKELRDLLLKRRDELVKEILEEVNLSKQGAMQRSADPTDQASDSADGDLALALAQSETDELNQIEEALKRIDSDEMGACEECGCSIPIERLRALPYATTCINCKRRRELVNSPEGLDEAWEAVHNSEEERGGDDD